MTGARLALLCDLDECVGWTDFDPPHPARTVRAAAKKGLVEIDGALLRITDAGRAALAEAEGVK